MITIADFQKLLNNQCSTQEYKRIQQEIDCRFSYIVRKLEKQLNWNVIWFDYENEDMIEGEVIKGFFDILKYKNYIYFKGEIIKDNEYENFKYNSKFPTKWLYEDFERSLEEDVKKYKVEQLLGIVSK